MPITNKNMEKILKRNLPNLKTLIIENLSITTDLSNILRKHKKTFKEISVYYQEKIDEICFSKKCITMIAGKKSKRVDICAPLGLYYLPHVAKIRFKSNLSLNLNSGSDLRGYFVTKNIST